MVKDSVVRAIYFSPTGTTQRIVEEITTCFSGVKERADFLKNPLEEEMIVFTENELAMFGMPVYSGRIPGIAEGMLQKVKGKETPAIIIVSYGNREYDDALLELKNIVEANGFLVIGAGAFISEHAIFPVVGKGRPDEEDKQKIKDFAAECATKLNFFSPKSHESIQVKGNFPYREAAVIPLKPSGDERCNHCGHCVSVCPVKAISQTEPRETNESLCISCCACIAACPQKARGFFGPTYLAGEKMFAANYSEPKQPDVFF